MFWVTIQTGPQPGNASLDQLQTPCFQVFLPCNVAKFQLVKNLCIYYGTSHNIAENKTRCTAFSKSYAHQLLLQYRLKYLHLRYFHQFEFIFIITLSANLQLTDRQLILLKSPNRSYPVQPGTAADCFQLCSGSTRSL